MNHRDRRLSLSSFQRGLAVLVLLGIGISPTRAGLILGVADHFESGTANWTNGLGAADPTIAAGGPNGASDHFLDVHSTGTSGAGSKLITFNRTQWAGDFTGVSSISMDFKNLGTTALSMRLALKSGTSISSPGYVSTTAFSLPVDNNWHHADFSLDSSSLTKIGAAAALNVFLTNPLEFRILSESANPPTSLDGDTVLATVGIDNIVAVPEPAAISLLAICGLFLIAWIRLRR